MARRRAWVVMGIPLLALLAGCVSPAAGTAQVAAAPESVTPLAIPPASVALETRKSWAEESPLSRRPDTDATGTAHWVAGRHQFAVVLIGSSTCPAIPISVGAVDESTISVVFVLFQTDDPDHACTTDASPIAYFFSTPPSLGDGDVTLELTFDHLGVTTDRIPITDYAA